MLVLQLLFPTWHNAGYCSRNISTSHLGSCCRILLGLTETLGSALQPAKIWRLIWLFNAKSFTAIYISNILLVFSIIATVANSSLANVGASGCRGCDWCTGPTVWDIGCMITSLSCKAELHSSSATGCGWTNLCPIYTSDE